MLTSKVILHPVRSHTAAFPFVCPCTLGASTAGPRAVRHPNQILSVGAAGGLSKLPNKVARLQYREWLHPLHCGRWGAEPEGQLRVDSGHPAVERVGPLSVCCRSLPKKCGTPLPTRQKKSPTTRRTRRLDARQCAAMISGRRQVRRVAGCLPTLGTANCESLYFVSSAMTIRTTRP